MSTLWPHALTSNKVSLPLLWQSRIIQLFKVIVLRSRRVLMNLSMLSLTRNCTDKGVAASVRNMGSIPGGQGPKRFRDNCSYRSQKHTMYVAPISDTLVTALSAIPSALSSKNLTWPLIWHCSTTDHITEKSFNNVNGTTSRAAGNFSNISVFKESIKERHCWLNRMAVVGICLVQVESFSIL